MFSMTTTELSTSIPIDSESPESDIMFILIPEKYMSTNAVSTENGMENATMSVGRISFIKSSSTTTARMAPTRILCSMLLMNTFM